jgi:hypothetical protein
MRGMMGGSVVCALAIVALMALMVPGYAGETSVKAWAVWQGQGRFYMATDNPWRSSLAILRASWRWRISKGPSIPPA